MVLKETVAYYTSNQSPVFCVMLDATKAFDRVSYVRLFRMLQDRNIPPVVLRFLLNSYLNQSTQVIWDTCKSEDLPVKNGVKQGGICSPIFFCVYLDGLLTKLHNSGLGCYIGYEFVGALAYADDLTLLAPTAYAMRGLLRICEDYAREFSILFNAKKSKCIVFEPASSDSRVSDLNYYFCIDGNAP